jgi:hypothetical protein
MPAARRMRTGIGAAVLLMLIGPALFVPALPAIAQPAGDPRQPGQRGQFGGQKPDRRDDARQGHRDEHAQRRREQQERRERMTPDERRGLRRDLDEAGRDLYRR